MSPAPPLSLIVAVLMAVLPGTFAQSAPEFEDRMPLLNDGVMIRVPASVFGETLYFSLDSGFTVSAVDETYRSRLGTALAAYSSEGPLGADGSVPVFPGPKMSVSGRLLHLNKITCLDLNMYRLVSGQPCDGVLGMDFFQSNVISIDFDNNQLSLSDVLPPGLKSSALGIPLQPNPQYYTLNVLVNHDRPLTLMVDTGDNSSLSLNPRDWQAVFGSRQTNFVVATLSDVANRVSQSKVGAIDRLVVGNFTYTNLHATFLPNPESPSHLGLGFFKRHKVTFDFANRMLYIAPGARFSSPDKEDMSGLHILREATATIVYSVDKNSPADNDGIKPLDSLEMVNGRPASSLTLRTIRQLLKSRDGDKVDLQIKRGADTREYALVLRKSL